MLCLVFAERFYDHLSAGREDGPQMAAHVGEAGLCAQSQKSVDVRHQHFVELQTPCANLGQRCETVIAFLGVVGVNESEFDLTPIRQIKARPFRPLPQPLDLTACFGCGGHGGVNATQTDRAKHYGERGEVRPINIVERANETFHLILAPLA
jgi:hypothetical protein